MKTYLSICQAAKILGISLSTMYRLEKLGKLNACFRTFGNHRRYLKADIDKISNNHNKKTTIAYARVSTYKQKNDLENQKNTLKNYCINNNINNYKIISDLGSGLNFKKKGLNTLIELIISQSISTLILTYKDRLLRFGNDIIFKLCHIFNIKIIILNNDINKTCEQEFSEDLCEIITVFSARLYGKRSHKNKKTIN